MGKTAFSGPAFGAKATLVSLLATPSTGSSAVFAGAIVPPGEDWYITDLSIYRGSSGSTNLVISMQDDSSLVAFVGVGGSSVTGGSAIWRSTADSGEYQGNKILSGSTITFSHSSHAGPNANVTVVLSGFRRWIASTTYRD